LHLFWALGSRKGKKEKAAVNGKAITAEIDSMGFLAAKRMQIKRDMMHQSGGLVGKPLRKVAKLVGISNKRILVVE